MAKKEANYSTFSWALVATEPFVWKWGRNEGDAKSCTKNKKPTFHWDKMQDGQPFSDRMIFFASKIIFLQTPRDLVNAIRSHSRREELHFLKALFFTDGTPCFL